MVSLLDNCVKAQTFDSGDVSFNAKAVVKMINGKMTRDQVISITMHEASVTYNESIMTVFYRERPLNMNTPVLTGVDFHYFKDEQSRPWDDIIGENFLLKQVQERAGCMLSLTHSSANEGEDKNKNNMVMFWSENKVGADNPSRILNNMEEYGECDPVVSSMPKYMKTHVMPHELISFSIYEDAHPFPANDGMLNCTVLHRASVEKHLVDPKRAETESNIEPRIIPLVRRVQGDLQSTDYKYTVFEGPQKGYRKQIWKASINQAVAYMNEIGPNEGHLVTCFNKTDGDKACVAVISWDRVIEDHFLAQQRPAGCCNNCSIF